MYKVGDKIHWMEGPGEDVYRVAVVIGIYQDRMMVEVINGIDRRLPSTCRIYIMDFTYNLVNKYHDSNDILKDLCSE